MQIGQQVSQPKILSDKNYLKELKLWWEEGHERLTLCRSTN